MQFSSDTIRGVSITLSSTLRNEELDDLLAMDCWFDVDMAPKKNASRTGLTEQDIRRIVKAEAAKASQPAATQARGSWWNKTPATGINLLVAIAASLVASLAASLLTLLGILASGYLNTRIDDRIDAKLKPTSDGIIELRHTVEKIQSQVSEMSGELKRIFLDNAKSLNPDELAERLPKVKDALQAVSSSGYPLSPTTLAALRSKLARIQPNVLDYWPTAFYVVNLESRSFVLGLNLKPASLAFGGVNQGISFERSIVNLSGPGELIDSTFRECLVQFSDTNPLKLKNVRFIRCEFLLPITEHPESAIEAIGKELLSVSNLENVTVSTAKG